MSKNPFSIQLKMAETKVSRKLKVVLVLDILIRRALIKPHRRDVRLECSHWSICWIVSSSSQRGQLLEECMPNWLSGWKVGIILLHTFVRRMLWSILSITSDKAFQTMDWIVESDHLNFVWRYHIYRGSVYARTSCLKILLVALMPQIEIMAGQLGRTGARGRNATFLSW